MITVRYAEILETLNRFDPWLRHLGIEPKLDRIHQAIKVLHTAEDGFQRARAGNVLARIGNVDDFYFGITEAFEFWEIFRAFEHEKASVIALKIKAALDGPLRPIHETPANAHGRNTMFELALGAEWRLRGANAILTEPDLCIQLDGLPFLVACKRPFRESSIRSNVRDAADQMRCHLELPENAESQGILAISISRILNPGDKIFRAPTEDDRHRLGDIVQSILRENERHWHRFELHPRIAGILFHVTTPGVVESTNTIVRMTYSVVVTVGKNALAHKLVREQLTHFFEH